MNVQPGHILIIDKQEHWRRLSTLTLQNAGFQVFEIGDYSDKWERVANDLVSVDLIILGCATIGPEEKRLIQQILQHQYRLLVFCTSLPWRVMRSLFLLGAEDVTDKTYDPRYLLETVEEMFPMNDFQSISIPEEELLVKVVK